MVAGLVAGLVNMPMDVKRPTLQQQIVHVSFHIHLTILVVESYLQRSLSVSSSLCRDIKFPSFCHCIFGLRFL